VTEDDVRRAVAAAATPLPSPAPEMKRAVADELISEKPAGTAAPEPRGAGGTADGQVAVTKTVPLRGIRQITAERMTHSFQTTPHFYLTMELDAAALLALRERLVQSPPSQGQGDITVTDLLVKFVATALAEHPYANATLKDGAIHYLGEVNIGIAVATEQGLVVPVIRQASEQSLRAIAGLRRELTERARAGRLTMEDVTGGTFTISNLGMYGVDLFSGIINPPQSALLAVGRIKERPYGVRGEIRLHPTFYVTLSVDHRVMDGAQAALLLQRIAEIVEQPATLLACEVAQRGDAEMK
jgi:pyruvate dehydrogenase E2 component (dihydrolipoamide acetyltransferase)